MKIWVDAQMSPAIATWISSNYAVSNARLKEVLTSTLPKALELLNFGEKLVEISAT